MARAASDGERVWAAARASGDVGSYIPVLERNMNAVGITTWAQVARLTPAQIDEVEGELGFKGRVLRDKWLEQADALATGGVAEYIKRFGKDPR